MELKGANAIDKWRTLLGPTDSATARNEAPLSVRAKFGTGKKKRGCIKSILFCIYYLTIPSHLLLNILNTVNLMFCLFLVLDNTKNAAHGSDSSKSAERVRTEGDSPDISYFTRCMYFIFSQFTLHINHACSPRISHHFL